MNKLWKIGKKYYIQLMIIWNKEWIPFGFAISYDTQIKDSKVVKVFVGLGFQIHLMIGKVD